MLHTWLPEPNFTHDQIVPMTTLNALDTASINAAVLELKAKPVAKRCIHLAAFDHAIFNLAPAGRPLEFAAAAAPCLKLATAVARALPAMAAIVLDNEDATNFWSQPPAMRPYLSAKTGITFTSDDFGPYSQQDSLVAEMNDACGVLDRAALRSGIFAAFRKYQPNALLSQFGEILASPADQLRDSNNHLVYASSLSGNVQSPAFYGGKGWNPRTATPFDQFLNSLDQYRLAAGNGRVLPWLAGDHVDNNASWDGSPFWDELQLHVLLANNKNALLFNAEQPGLLARFAALIAQVDQVQGKSLADRPVSTDRLLPTAIHAATAMVDDELYPTRFVARVTFAPDVHSAELQICGQGYTARPDAGGVGCWLTGALN